jgi:hypothetical protein
MAKHTKEGKIATAIVESVNDFTLDLDSVGRNIAQVSNTVLYNRLEAVMESAREHKYQDDTLDIEKHYEMIRRLGQ